MVTRVQTLMSINNVREAFETSVTSSSLSARRFNEYVEGLTTRERKTHINATTRWCRPRDRLPCELCERLHGCQSTSVVSHQRSTQRALVQS